MKTLNILSIGVIALAALAMGLRSLTVKIDPGQTGVLNAEWTSGLVREDFKPGFHWDVGPLHTWTIFDTTVQTLSMSRREETQEGPLQVKSSDGATVTMDVTVKYRIKPGRTWKIFTDNGPGEAYKIKVRNETIDVLRRQMGALKTEEFYDPRVRRGKTEAMELALRASLDQREVELVQILIRDLKFDEAFEARIRDKTLAQQDVELNQARTEAAKERGKTNEIVAQTSAKVVVIGQEREKTLIALRANNDQAITQIRADASKKDVELRSDADLYVAQQRATGDLEVKRAGAEAERLRREALAVPGADIYVALQLVESLRLQDIAISTQTFDPLDIDALIKRLTVR